MTSRLRAFFCLLLGHTGGERSHGCPGHRDVVFIFHGDENAHSGGAPQAAARPMTVLSFLFLLWMACGLAASLIAASKARSGCGWFVLGILFGPLAILAIAVASPDSEAAVRAGLQSRKLRRCPTCAEVVQMSARKCRHCASELPPPPRYDWLGREVKS